MRVCRKPDRFGLEKTLHAFPAVFPAVPRFHEAADSAQAGGVEIVIDINSACLDTVCHTDGVGCIPRPNTGSKTKDRVIGLADHCIFIIPGFC